MKPTIFQYSYGSIPEELQPFVDSTKQWADDHDIGHEIIWRPSVDSFPSRLAMRTDCDNQRVQLLADTPKAIYIDMDCKLTDKFEYIDDGKPHFSFYPIGNSSSKPQPATILFWGPCEFFKAMLEKRDRRYPNIPDAWSRKVLRDWPGVVQIPPDQYIHTLFSDMKIRKDRNTK